MILVSEEHIEQYTAGGWWGSKTLYDLFRTNADQALSSEALVDAPNKPVLTGIQPWRLTYEEVIQRVDWLAASFLEMGLKKDDVMMVQLPNIAEIVCVYLAAARIGVIVSPLAMQYRTHEMKHSMTLTEPKAFVTITDFNGVDMAQIVQSLQPDFPSLQYIIALGSNVPASVISFDKCFDTPHDTKILDDYLRTTPVTANDVFTICWTSGTEAEPKGVPRSHNEWIAIGRYCNEGCEVQPGYNILIDFPMINMSSIGGIWLPWLLTGAAKLVLHHPFDLQVMLKQVQDENISYTLIPPAILNMLLQNEALFNAFDISCLKSIGSGSAPLSPWMVKGYQEKHGMNVHNVFGGNEGISFLGSAREFTDPEVRATYFPRWGVPGFKWNVPIAASLESKLVDTETGQIITEPGVPGDMWIKGPSVFSGYYKRPDLTAKSFDGDGFFNTGDLFSIETDENGVQNRYKFHGRSKDLIIRGGFNVSPEEVENMLIQHPKILEVAVVGYPDETMGEKGCACVVLKPGQTITLDEISDFLTQQDCAIYKRPEKLMVLEALPRNPLNKVVKKELRKMLLEA